MAWIACAVVAETAGWWNLAARNLFTPGRWVTGAFGRGVNGRRRRTLRVYACGLCGLL